MRIGIIAPAICLLLGITAMAGDDHIIVQSGRAFHPGEVTINKGDTITFENHDDFIHQIYVAASDFSFDSAEHAPGDSLNETFTVSGTFEVHCHIHPKMLLVVHVK